MIIYRKRDFFYEYYLTPINNILCIPKITPQKFDNRIQCFSIFKGYKCIEVKSNVQPFSEINFHYLAHCEGVWIVADDTIKKGDFKPEGVEGKRQFFGMEIDEQCEIINLFDSFLNPTIKVLSLYHGTNQENMSQIIQNGYKETEGMLGKGVYMGTFWKGARFACFDKKYVKRKGIITRNIVFGNIAELKEKCDCNCDSKISDHLSIWRKNFDGLHCTKQEQSTGIGRDGKPKYLLKNDEWIVKSTNIILTHSANIEIKGESYEPLNRSIICA